MAKKSPLRISTEEVERSILLIRGQKVMLDADLASLYGVAVKALNQAVKRNVVRFPNDFMFRLSREEWSTLRSHIVTLKDANEPTATNYRSQNKL